MRKTRLCGSRSFLRRSEVRRGADRDPAVDSYNAQRRKLVTERASFELRPGTIPEFGVNVAVRRAATPTLAAGAGEPTVGRLGEVVGDTVHFDIIDRAGNMVSSTPSGGWLQSSPVIPELGFCLGTRAQMFWLEEGHPASLAPGKRPRTTLTPTMALRDGEPYLAGGPRAATSKISGRRNSFCATFTRVSTCRNRSTPRPGTRNISQFRSGRVPRVRVCWWSKAA